ncbi:MAG: LysR family transcriptional regulator [Paracoccaceae bacterium]
MKNAINLANTFENQRLWECDMPSRLSIKAMQYFLAAVDSGSLTTAAQKLNVAPSAISNGIDQIEEEFQLDLVQRFPAKGIHPTTTGKTMVQRIRRLIEEYESLLSGGKELRESLSGKLTIGYYAPVAPSFLPGIAAPLLNQNKDIRLEFIDCNNESAQTGLLNGDFDVILFVADNAKPGIKCEALIDAPPYLLVPKSHGLASLDSVSFHQLQEVDLVLLDLPFTAQYLQGLLDENSIKPRIVATASTTEMVRSLVGAGVGCSILNMRPLIDVTYGGDRVKAIPLKTLRKPLALSLGYINRNPRRVVSTFIKSCLYYFGQDSARALTTKSEYTSRWE